jgi:murein L,D-transpeptidase YcbB/YkuD
MWLKQLIRAVKTLVKTADSTERGMLDERTEEKVNKNLYWQEKLGWGLGDICKVLKTTRLSPVESASFVKRVTNWQRARGLVSDGIVGPNTWRIMSNSLLTPKQRAVRRTFRL